MKKKKLRYNYLIPAYKPNNYGTNTDNAYLNL